MTIYYFYTTVKHAALIEEEGKIRAGSCALGPGIFFTTAGPEDTKPAPLEMLKQIIDEEKLPSNTPLTKHTEFFAFKKDQLSLKRKKKGIFFMLNTLMLSDVTYTRGQVDLTP
eukprot:TRINITY_DN6536_c0_g2_i2.p1 TRINITY_DN6536_c0_g2~~TRINITY_DN6536_c0_g2_i2.p1  ORF type:complete len:132 (+),score=56.06 TRINITY_DN6536_c0_g2_i2:60-398(+)